MSRCENTIGGSERQQSVAIDLRHAGLQAVHSERIHTLEWSTDGDRLARHRGKPA
jgi:hypothetical protein